MRVCSTFAAATVWSVFTLTNSHFFITGIRLNFYLASLIDLHSTCGLDCESTRTFHMENATMSAGSSWRQEEDAPVFSNASLCLAGVIICIGVIIVVLNALTISAILRFNTLRSGTNYLLFSMALSDLALGVTMIFCEGAFLLRLQSAKSCKLCVMFVSISVSTSLVTIIAIAVERFSAVVYPLKHRVRMSKKRVVTGCALLWMLELTLFLVNALVYTPEPPRVFSLQFKPACAAYAFSEWLAVTLTVVVPVYCIVCAVLYRKIYLAAVEHMRRIHGLQMAPNRKGYKNGSSRVTVTSATITAMSDLSDNNGSSRHGNQTTATTEMPDESNDEEIKVLPAIKPLDNQRSNQNEEKCEDCINIRIAIMTFLVVVALVICYLPFILTNIIKAVHGNPSSPWQYWLYEITLLGIYCNSFLDPILYTWHSKDFRQAFRALFLKPCGESGTCSK